MSTTPCPRWRAFEVWVDGFGWSTLSAVSAGAARYSRYMDFRAPYPDTTFAEFCRMSRVRVCPEPSSEPYDYIRRAYSVDLRVDDLVELQHEGPSWNGKRGQVVHPGRQSTAHAHVAMPGYPRPLIVHPLNVRVVGRA